MSHRGIRSRASVLLVAVAALVAASAGGLAPRAAAASSPAPSGPGLRGIDGTLQLAGVSHPAHAAPRAASPEVAPDLARPAPERRSPQRRTVSPSVAPSQQFLPEIVEGRLGVTQLAAVQGVQHDTQGAAVSPPDTNVSASATTVVEVVNLSLLAMNRDGSNSQQVALKNLWQPALNQVGSPNADLSDPRIVFDAESQRWFTSIVFYDPGLVPHSSQSASSHSWIGIAVSTDATPAAWNVYAFQSQPGILIDQPGLGVNSDKITVGGNDFDEGQSNEPWTGAQLLVANKAQMVAGSATVSTTAFQDSTAFGYAPAVSRSATTTEYVAQNYQPFNGSAFTGPQEVKVEAITGVPGVSTVHDSPNDIVMCPSCGNQSLTGWPAAVQQPNSSVVLDPGDDRFLAAVYQNGKLWTGGSTAVATGPESALSVFEVDTASMTLPLEVAVDSGRGESFFYPNIALDQNGTPFIAFSRGSASRYASSGAGVLQVSGQNASFLTAGVLNGGAGQGPYDCSCTGGTPPTRFGDYSGSAVDPADPSTVWVASEYSGVGDGHGNNWATLLTRVTLDGPTATNSSPGSGLTRGGTWVTVNGNDFDLNSTVLFGGVPAQAVQWRGQQQLVALSPPHRAGRVDVTVQTPSGAATLPGAFVYNLPPRSGGYWLDASDGGIFPFGNAGGYGSTGNVRLNQPMVGMASTPDGGGYWLVASDGGIFPFGDAGGYGSTGNIRLNKPVVGMAATPSGHGYWLVASDGGIFPFGDAGGYGSTGNIRLNQPIVGMAASPTGRGYWLVASDGGIFPFGDAVGWGSTGNIRLNQPIVGMAQSGDDGGYWLVASDGGIFPFGDAVGYGSTGNIRLNRPMVGMAASQP